MLSKGWKRLAIALGVPYFGIWALMFVGNLINYQSARDSQMKNIALGNESRARFDGEWALNTIDGMMTAITWGVAVPVLVLIIFVIARWVYRGFRPLNPGR